MAPPQKIFGQTMSKQQPRRNGNGQSNYRRQMGSSAVTNNSSSNNNNASLQIQRAKKKRQQMDAVDSKFGYERHPRHHADTSSSNQDDSRRGWVFNVHPTVLSDERGVEHAALDLYMLDDNGDTFKSAVVHHPYFYLMVDEPRSAVVKNDVSVTCYALVGVLQRLYGHLLYGVSVEYKEDLDLVNHLSGKKQAMLKLTFANEDDLLSCKGELKPIILKNRSRKKDENITRLLQQCTGNGDQQKDNTLDQVIGMREHDVPYTVRTCIDLDIRAGCWYTMTPNPVKDQGFVKYSCTASDQDFTTKGNPRYLAFDIECTKAPLKFPQAEVDEIYMISYMCDGQGYLINSRSVVAEDVPNFEYTPKPNFPGPFHIFNERDEKALIERFISHYQELKPQIVITYNGDFFDWPFLEARAKRYNMDIESELGVSSVVNNTDTEYRGRCCVHLDAFSWVKRDSYLPQGAQGLKAVTKYKLGYDPVEVDPEDMVRFAHERPVHMATYSVSDAVATYYLYEKYVHLFIFSLCTIIPMGPEDVLRKGSGTLCEALLMVEAFKGNIICPNKQSEADTKFYKGHLLESETYIGGHVECLEAGVYRSDVKYDFNVNPNALEGLIRNIDRDLAFAIEVEAGMDRFDVTNYDAVRNEIVQALEHLRDNPKMKTTPYIYHLDVGAMYPNIILTNRLQPDSIVDDTTCAGCVYNRAESNCKRRMEWIWRGDYTPSTKAEYEGIKTKLQTENVDGVPFHNLDSREQANTIKGRLKEYSRKAYRKTKITTEESRTDTVCMRENPFYVETVRLFRDRRYEYKLLTKKWKKEYVKADKAGDVVSSKHAQDQSLVYDSLQVAHKCILNSFYGYVMRKGARWRSMEMAGIVTLTGANIIKQARELVENIGRPLELDTDGIWCILPSSFPDKYTLYTNDGSPITVEYPCAMLNAAVHNNFSNHQYQQKNPKKSTYQTRSECSIFFEVDGPYRCMVLPASLEENVLLKKRYAVFNFDGSLAELKGFELKRRGELELIKAFQSQVFERFLDGGSLQECYNAVADIANHWLDVLYTQGVDLDTDELFDLISENRSMSRQLDDYGDQKGTSQTTARRLGEFLGSEIIKDKGLNCKFIIAERPFGAPVTERAIPTAIWKSEPAVMKNFLRKWLKASDLDDFDLRNILDWDYYKDRLSKTIQKIITIPAGLQGLMNPVPRVDHPSWLERRVRGLLEGKRQLKMDELFSKATAKEGLTSKKNTPISLEVADMEDFGKPTSSPPKKPIRTQDKALSKASIVTPPKVLLNSESFFPWLDQRKKAWRNSRLKSRQPRIGISTNTKVDKKRKLANVQSYLQHQMDTVQASELHVVEVRDTDTPGQFLVWCVVANGSALHKLIVTIPRTLYTNSRTKLELGKDIRATNRHLPHAATLFNLYEVTIKETSFQKKIESLIVDKMDQNYYGTKAPLWLSALENIFCCSCIKNSREPVMASNKYKVEDLQRIEKPTTSYLSNLSKTLYLYESSHRQGVGVFGFFINDTTSRSAEGFIFISGGGVDGMNSKQCRGIYSSIATQLQEMDLPHYRNFVSLTLKSCTRTSTIGETHDLINQQINLFLQARPGPSVLLHSTNTPIQLLSKHIAGLNGLPLCAIKSPESMVLSVDWQQRGVQLCLEQYLASVHVTLPYLVCLSKYSGIPIGNLGEDPLGRVFDVHFTQFLSKNKCVSWASLDPFPDLGTESSGLVHQDDDESTICILRNKGVYRSICVELDIRRLLVAALFNSEDSAIFGKRANQLSDKHTDFGGGVFLGDETSCSIAVAVFRQLLQKYLKDSSLDGDEEDSPAAELLEHVYRIVASPNTLLHDPTFHRCLQKLMRDVFLQLLSSLQTLGCSVVYGSFSRIVVCTKKVGLHAAKEYIDFILSTLKQQDNTRHLHIRPNRVWSHYIFMDEYNYGGVEFQMREEDEISDEEFGKDYVSTIGSMLFVPTVVGHWNMKEYLTEDVSRAYFQTIIGRFSREAFKKQMTLLSECENSVEKEEEISSEIIKFVKRQVSVHFTNDLTRMLSELIREGGDASSFPTLPGSHLPLSNPALEFTKTIMSILELDEDVQHESHVLRRSALTQLGIREYSQSTIFRNPCAEFILTDLFCTECVETRDLNLCIGGVTITENDDGSSTAKKTEWLCDECDNPYNANEIEWRLIDLIQKESVQFQLQDLRCSKTGKVARGCLSRESECSAPWKPDTPNNKLVKRIKILQNLARFHGLNNLLESCTGLLHNYTET